MGTGAAEARAGRLLETEWESGIGTGDDRGGIGYGADGADGVDIDGTRADGAED